MMRGVPTGAPLLFVWHPRRAERAIFTTAPATGDT